VLAFVYGTLTDPDRARAVLERDPEFAAPAVLDGCHRAEGAYPTLVPGGDCEGRLLRIERPDLHRLDAYEGVDDGLYVRVSVPFVTDGAHIGTVETYVGDPGRLDAPGSWPGEGPFTERVRRYVEAEDVVVRRMD
jgi:gamma-glutamylaminecyclotransferase